MRNAILSITAILVLAASACTNSPTSPGFAGGDCPPEAQRYTDGAGNYWCQLPNGSKFPTS